MVGVMVAEWKLDASPVARTRHQKKTLVISEKDSSPHFSPELLTEEMFAMEKGRGFRHNFECRSLS
jgi:hypothetical protein